MIYEGLNPEIKEKARACKTQDELKTLAEAEGFSLSEEELQGVSGGSLEGCNEYYKRSDFYCDDYHCGTLVCDPFNCGWVTCWKDTRS